MMSWVIISLLQTCKLQCMRKRFDGSLKNQDDSTQTSMTRGRCSYRQKMCVTCPPSSCRVCMYVCECECEQLLHAFPDGTRQVTLHTSPFLQTHSLLQQDESVKLTSVSNALFLFFLSSSCKWIGIHTTHIRRMGMQLWMGEKNLNSAVERRMGEKQQTQYEVRETNDDEDDDGPSDWLLFPASFSTESFLRLAFWFNRYEWVESEEASYCSFTSSCHR